jgi:antitoxin component of RelBE/YafQ-DinJ toxin-antitoxin module
VADSLHKLCVDAAVTVLAGLGLDGSPAVRAVLLEDETNATVPRVDVSIEDEAETVRALTSASREVELPVRVVFVGPVANTGADRLPGWTLDRQAVLDAFPDRRVPAYPAGVFGCRAVPRETAGGSQRAVGRVVGEIELRFRAVRAVQGV